MRVAIILLLLVVLGCSAAVLTIVPAQPQEPQLYAGISPNSALLRLDKQALDEAYHDQLKKLFMVWIASGAPKEAVQFSTGLRTARRAYDQAAQQIAKREQELLEQDRR